MKLNSNDENLKSAYKKIENKIISGNEHKNFIDYLIKQTDFANCFVVNGNLNVKNAKMVINNLDYLHFLCEEDNLNKENEFHDFLIKSLETDALIDIEKVIYTFMLETKYGNPKRKEDFTLNDRLFYVLQAIYELDNLILACNNSMTLVNRFNEVMQTSNIDDFTDFINEFSEMRKKLSKIQNEEELSIAFNEEKEFLIPYVAAGIDRQYTEVSKDENGNFSKVDALLRLISDDLGFSANKNIVK